MNASRELDALISEKIMGWKVMKHYEPGVVAYWHDSNQVEQKETPHYSTDISAAWLVVEKINLLGWDFSIQVDHEFKENQVAIEKKVEDAEFTVSTIGPYYFLGVSAPHTICLAALKAIEP